MKIFCRTRDSTEPTSSSVKRSRAGCRFILGSDAVRTRLPNARKPPPVRRSLVSRKCLNLRQIVRCTECVSGFPLGWRMDYRDICHSLSTRPLFGLQRVYSCCVADSLEAEYCQASLFKSRVAQSGGISEFSLNSGNCVV
jgi:hypothetical protein